MIMNWWALCFIFHIIQASPVVNYEKIVQTTEQIETPRITPVGNYSVTFVPLITLIVNAIPRIVDRLRPQTSREIVSVPDEFINMPCLDFILERKKYPSSDCHLYECKLHEPATALCRIQVINDTLNSIDLSKVMNNPVQIRISECLDIKVYRCLYGHVFSEKEKQCVRDSEGILSKSCPA